MDISQPNSGPKINPINLALNTKNNFWECEAWAKDRQKRESESENEQASEWTRENGVCAHTNQPTSEKQKQKQNTKKENTHAKNKWKKERTGGVATKSFKDKSICENVKQEMVYVRVWRNRNSCCLCVIERACVCVCAIVIELWSSAYDSKSKPNIEYTQRQTMNDNSNSYDSMLNPDQSHAPVQIYLSVCCCWHELEVESSVCSNVCMCMSARVWAAVTATATAASLYDALSIRFRSVLCCAVL